MNFNIIDGYDDIDYDTLLEDYRNLELSVKEIQKKHGLTIGKWQSITREWKEKGIKLRGRQNQRKNHYPGEYIGAKNYYYSKSIGKYTVSKHINGKYYYFGTFGTEEEAQARVKELRENNWDGLLE